MSWIRADKNIWTTLGGVGHDMGCTLLILTCAAVCVLTICHAVEDDTAEITDTYQKVIEYAESYPDDFFLLDRPTISRLTYTSTATPFTCFSRTSHQNVCIQGGMGVLDPCQSFCFGTMGDAQCLSGNW